MPQQIIAIFINNSNRILRIRSNVAGAVDVQVILLVSFNLYPGTRLWRSIYWPLYVCV